MKNNLAVSSALTVLIVASGGAAYAQNDTPAADAPPAEATTLNKVVVEGTAVSDATVEDTPS
ncbi:MAG: hypothetical protein VYB93_12820, partial [Pseudomonadota bacterium]|nr:hypothetical protein [Pseudomonadota bacterium]